MTRLEELTQELTVELCENIQTQYDDGYMISQDVVYQTFSELLKRYPLLMETIGDDYDDECEFLRDITSNIAMNL